VARLGDVEIKQGCLGAFYATGPGLVLLSCIYGLRAAGQVNRPCSTIV
jgi:hypothetical protein